jgi:heat shock protein HslJ
MSLDIAGMWESIAIRSMWLACPVLAACPSLGAEEPMLRYRGQYTYGHEVNTFCPDINSQCYWVASDTPDAVRATLKKLQPLETVSPYTPLCIVIEGRIDRETARSGFAADYDGLITVDRVFGRCDETAILTQGDLQHHRWILESINGVPLDLDEREDMIPELDFGERMTVTGNTGCNRLSGRASLKEQYFLIEHLASTRRLCAPPRDTIERTLMQVVGDESVIQIDSDRNLILKSKPAQLRFRLRDWVQ